MDLSDIDWPVFGLQDDVRPLLSSLREAGQPAVLATLVAAEGGSPRGLGAQMLFGSEAVTGYLSGGCVEADVALHAETVMADAIDKDPGHAVGHHRLGVQGDIGLNAAAGEVARHRF